MDGLVNDLAALKKVTAAKQKTITELNAKIAAQDAEKGTKNTEINSKKTDKTTKETDLKSKFFSVERFSRPKTDRPKKP